MKTQIKNYTFDASAQTVEFDDYASIDLDSILIIYNVTDNVAIYNFAATGLGGTVATNVVTLDYDTTSMSDTDDLLIFYEESGLINTATSSLNVYSTNTNAGEDTDNDTVGVTFKPVVDSVYSPTPFYATSDIDYIVSNTPAQLYSVWATNKGGTLLYLQVHNSATVPSGGATPLATYPLYPGTSDIPGFSNIGASEFGIGGLHCSTGLTITISSTMTTYTAHGTASDINLGGFYVQT